MAKEGEELYKLKAIEIAAKHIIPVVPHSHAVLLEEQILVLMMASIKPVAEIVHEYTDDGNTSQHITLPLGEYFISS